MNHKQDKKESDYNTTTFKFKADKDLINTLGLMARDNNMSITKYINIILKNHVSKETKENNNGDFQY